MALEQPYFETLPNKWTLSSHLDDFQGPHDLVRRQRPLEAGNRLGTAGRERCHGCVWEFSATAAIEVEAP